MTNLSNIVTQIKELSSDVQAFAFNIAEEGFTLMTAKKEQASIKAIFERVVLSNPELKNEKSRELALKDLLSTDNDYARVEREIYNLEYKIHLLENNKAESKIELDYFKNMLRIAEIEAMTARV